MPVLSVLQVLFSFLSFTQLSLWHHEKGKVEVYDIDRAVKDYQMDKTALESMFINIHSVTRYYLLLHHFL
jgi:hypothetical protein